MLNLSRGQIFLVFFDLLSLLGRAAHVYRDVATAFIVVLIIGSTSPILKVVIRVVPFGSTACICSRLVVFEALAPLLIVGLLAAILLLVVVSCVLVTFNMTIASSGPIVHIAPVILVTAGIVVVILHILAATIASIGAIFIIAHVAIVLSLLVTTSHGTAISHVRATSIVGADIARRLQRTFLFVLVLLLLLLLLLSLLRARRDMVDSTAALVVVAVVALVAIVSVAARLLVAIILHAIIIVAI